jgi:ankyrin repeat protein
MKQLWIYFLFVVVSGTCLAQNPSLKMSDRTKESASRLYNAVVRNDTTALKSLITNGVSINTPYENGWHYCFHDAVKISKFEMAKLILSLGFDVKIKGEKQMDALHIACSSVTPLSLVEEILRKGADINGIDEKGFTALHHAAYTGNYEIAKLLLESGANPALKDNSQQTPANIAGQIREKELASLIRSYLKQ